MQKESSYKDQSFNNITVILYMVSCKINSFVWIEFIGMVNENQTKYTAKCAFKFNPWKIENMVNL